MALRLRLPGGRWTVAVLVVSALVGSVALWHSFGYIDRYRNQFDRIWELRVRKATVSIRPAEVAGFWRNLPGVDPDIFQEVTEVSFHSGSLTSHWLSLLEGMTEIETLRIPDSTITDGGAKFLETLPKLQTLELKSSKMTDATAELVAQRQTLKHLTFHGSEIGNKSVQAIASLPQLETLDLQGGRINDQALTYLAQLPSLKSLSLSGKFSDEGLEKLQGCKQLVSLEMFALGATDRTLRALRTLPHLERLSIAEGAYTDDAVLDLKTWPQLKHFSCQGASIAATPKKWALLTDKPSGVVPNLGTPDGDRFYELGGFADEKFLVVGSEWTGDDWDIAHGAAFKDVTDVNINSPRVHDGGIVRLVRFGNKLQSLTIGDADITPAVASYLARMPMQWLSLSGAKIDDSWVPALEQLTNVSRLELVNSRISPEGVEKLKAAGVKVVLRSKKPAAQQDPE